MTTIDRSHPVMVDPCDLEGPLRTTWGEFLDNNAEALGEAEVARIERDLLKRPGCAGYMTLDEANALAHRRIAILAVALADSLEALLAANIDDDETLLNVERYADPSIVNRAKALLKKVGR